MTSTIQTVILSAAFLAFAPARVWTAESSSPPNTATAREEAVLVSITASVEAVDLDRREVTLRGPLGNRLTLAVDTSVKRLHRLKVGDLVRADYYIAIAAEVRKPTPEEENAPLVALAGSAKAPPGSAPAAGSLRRFKVVTTVEGLDRPTQTLTLKGPMGNLVTVRVPDPSRLADLRIGDRVVVTLTEALAISLDPVERRKVK